MQLMLRRIKHKKLSSVSLIPLSFLNLVILGTLVLMLPVSTASGEPAPFLTALFTATTSACVTGSIVVTTCSYWSTFGKAVILVLIQLGGLGIITVSALVIYLAKKRLSLNSQLLLRDTFNLDTFNGVTAFLSKVFMGTLIVELSGAFLYCIRFIPRYGVRRGMWYSLFTAISAFCNAGIDILGPTSLEEYQTDHYILFTTMLMIVLGGLGYVVWFDIKDGIDRGMKTKRGWMRIHKRLSEHTRLVLAVTFVLIFGGAFLIFLMEYSNPETLGNMSLADKVINAIFQSVTSRTAGFAAVPQAALREPTTIVMDMLMFVGGSPVGTAGGVKTTTVCILLMNLVSFIRSRHEIVIFRKKINNASLRKAAAIFFINLLLIFVITIMLSFVDGIGMADCFYEVTSAVSTVGLSRNVTDTLSTAGQVMIIVAMFLGRIGPISMALLLGEATMRKNHVSVGDGHFYIG